MAVQSENYKIGEVQSVPTGFTILDRLKKVHDDLYLIQNGMIARTEVTRPADVTPYVGYDIIDNTGATTLLPTLDFGITYANRFVEIQNIILVESDQLIPTMAFHFFKVATLGALNVADNTQFLPAYNDIKNNLMASVNIVSTDDPYYFAYAVARSAKGLTRIIQLDAEGKTYFAMQLLAVYTPLDSQKITVIVNGFCR